MAKGFKHGAGGTSLNFKVVANPQPSSPAENTIWVDTDRINNYYFSATQPENMVDYDVWFPVGTSSSVEFNALKKGCIDVYPQAAKQYVNGGLTTVTAMSYISGQWKSWWDGSTLYDAGDQVTGITGGWEKNTNMKISGASNTHVTFNDASMTIGHASSGSGIVSTVNKIDLTTYSKINFKVDIRVEGGSDSYGVIANYGDVYTKYAAAKVNTGSSTGIRTIAVDISALSGEYYVFCGADKRIRDIHKVWLE